MPRHESGMPKTAKKRRPIKRTHEIIGHVNDHCCNVMLKSRANESVDYQSQRRDLLKTLNTDLLTGRRYVFQYSNVVISSYWHTWKSWSTNHTVPPSAADKMGWCQSQSGILMLINRIIIGAVDNLLVHSHSRACFLFLMRRRHSEYVQIRMGIPVNFHS